MPVEVRLLLPSWPVAAFVCPGTNYAYKGKIHASSASLWEASTTEPGHLGSLGDLSLTSCKLTERAGCASVLKAPAVFCLELGCQECLSSGDETCTLSPGLCLDTGGESFSALGPLSGYPSHWGALMCTLGSLHCLGRHVVSLKDSAGS